MRLQSIALKQRKRERASEEGTPPTSIRRRHLSLAHIHILVLGASYHLLNTLYIRLPTTILLRNYESFWGWYWHTRASASF